MQALTLIELNHLVRATLEEHCSEPVWLQAEVSSVNENKGHCFVDFIQKSPDGYTIIAKASAHIWKSKWQLICPYFVRTTGQPLSVGMEILVEVIVDFTESHGYALNIIDINPTFTLGEMARKRQEIIRQLKQEGVFDMNKTLQLPQFLQRIAVISSESAAGWGDFQNQLNSNSYSLAFTTKLFPAIMQGEKVEQTIISALNQIAEECDLWDVVVIIRGGGASADLTGFDTLLLAENVAQFPLPIITGIGHERDDTVLDLISHTRVKTPTAAAEFLIHHQLQQLYHIEELKTAISESVAQQIHNQKIRLSRLTERIPTLFEVYKNNHLYTLDRLITNIRTSIQNTLKNEKHRMEIVVTRLEIANPQRLFRLGYTIVRKDGKAVKDASQLSEGDILEISFENGTVSATVNSNNK